MAPTHASPGARLTTHAPASQKFPVVQLASFAHVAAHAPEVHDTYGAHVRLARGAPLTELHVPTDPVSAHA